MTPDGFAEELALERAAATELEEEAAECWRLRMYGNARELRAEALVARRHVAELEALTTKEEP